jgi:hypothetical protein
MGRDVPTQDDRGRARETGRLHPELRLFIDRVIVPALLERFLHEHAAARPTSVSAVDDLPKADATV